MQKLPHLVSLNRLEDSKPFCDEYQKRGWEYRRHYRPTKIVEFWLDDEEAKEIAEDDRVKFVELAPHHQNIYAESLSQNYGQINRTYTGPSITTNLAEPTDRNWGQAFTSSDPNSLTSWVKGVRKTNTVDIFGDGRNVDVVIADDLLGYDAAEWISPSTGQSRFIRYQWFDQWNFYENGVPLPAVGSLQYGRNSTLTDYHGNHCGGTAAGQFYGYATEANIYSLPLLNVINPVAAYTYLLSFIKNKPINPATGVPNPTIISNSWGYVDPNNNPVFPSSDLSQAFASITINGVTYTAQNPNPSGWTDEGIRIDTGFIYAYHSGTERPIGTSIFDAVMEDVLEAGGVVVCAAGNESLELNYNETFSNLKFATLTTGVNVFMSGRLSPGGAIFPVSGTTFPPPKGDKPICVGALEHFSDYWRKADFSNFGPTIDIYAPGNNTPSASVNNGLSPKDSKYGGDNWYRVTGGTSMATPHVTGLLACFASGTVSGRFTNKDARQVLKDHSILDRIKTQFTRAGTGNTFRYYANDINPQSGSIDFEDYIGNPVISPVSLNPLNFIDITISPNKSYIFWAVLGVGPSSSYWEMDDFSGSGSQQNPTINVNRGETIEFNFFANAEPMEIRTNPLDANTRLAGNIVTYFPDPTDGNQGNAVLINTDQVDPLVSTIYYVSTQNPSTMQGAINLSTFPSSDVYYLKTARTLGTGDQVSGATGQGAQSVNGQSAYISWTIPESAVGTSVYLQSSTNLNNYLEFQIVPFQGNFGKFNTYGNPYHIPSGDNRSAFLRPGDERRVVGKEFGTPYNRKILSPQKGRTLGQLYNTAFSDRINIEGYSLSYPRPNRYYKPR